MPCPSLRFAASCLLIAIAAIACRNVVAEEAPSLRVMSFNIRYGTAKDGENHWDKRKAHVVDTIKAYRLDLLGTQETLPFQRDYLAENLPLYDSLAAGRDDGRDSGETVALFYRRERFEKLDGGHFWLSETPDKPGSKSWDSSLPRMVTWVKLRDRQSPTAQPITFFNTHFDHKGQEARLKSAQLLRTRLVAVAKDSAIVVTGDFNAGPASAPHQALFGEVEGEPSPIVDTFGTQYPDSQRGTFSGFNPKPANGARIDWIGAGRSWKIKHASIDISKREGRTPSDHWPVFAELR
ncbi:Endonuclease/Exonuclease/phosphatase family protein [Anatilimnocola aggregata]|uniref:Endonuclease/Exonuclease/phosphatase family protein n=1 Tax=Anatilimnocola aggregata TaxID=2528021 RepID=A0A517Y4S8_9BACT|nr:endonuclease/exonuclease/phosphatase family protein [Anatilimnocola aggregata]QDU25254.1 Endonuclease/Exonuclease/phosphatase family protein [Anatilimnocola aggregata]